MIKDFCRTACAMSAALLISALLVEMTAGQALTVAATIQTSA